VLIPVHPMLLPWRIHNGAESQSQRGAQLSVSTSTSERHVLGVVIVGLTGIPGAETLSPVSGHLMTAVINTATSRWTLVATKRPSASRFPTEYVY
jgi:hypothetical protein